MSSSAGSGAADNGAADAGYAIPVVCGPTAAGKSRIALQVAARHPVTIISADSRQIYRRFDIGTAKPSMDEMRAVPHRGIDVVDPNDRYSAAQWAALAEGAIDESLADGRIPLVVGGTGFYISALFRPLFEEPGLDPVARRAMQDALAALSIGELRRWCAALDPARSHLGRAQLLRAIEVALLSGERLSDLHRRRARSRRFRPSYLLVDPGPVLSARIVARAEAMLAHGWPEEVRALMQDVPEQAPAWGATGYETVRRLVRGEIDRAAALEQVVIDTRQYAKRQRTWFRNQLASDHVTHVGETLDPAERIVDHWMTGLMSGLRTHQPREIRA